MRRRLEACPWTLIVALASLALSLPVLVAGRDAPLPSLLELRGDVVAQPWRWLTGHLVHLSGRQLLLNLAAFLWLGLLTEPKMPRRYGFLLVGSSLAVSAGVLLLQPRFGVYRGLSGIASAQFAALAALRARDARRGRPAELAAPVGALLLFFAKTVFELRTGRGLFIGSLGLAGGFASPSAHLAGALSGLAFALLFGRSCAEPRAAAAAGVDPPLPLISASRVG